MLTITPKLGEFLVKATHSKSIDEALNRVFTDYLDLKLKNLLRISEDMQTKWGMTFDEFKKRFSEGALKKDSYSFEVENDFWQWEETETLRRHYEDLKIQWT